MGDYASTMGWASMTEKYKDHDGNESEMTYYVDAETETAYFTKVDHHGHAPEDMRYCSRNAIFDYL